MGSLSNLWGREPVLILGLLRAVIVFATAFGLQLTVEQTAAVYLLAEAILSVVTRTQVSPA